MRLTPIDDKIDFKIIGRDGGNIFLQCLLPALRVTTLELETRNQNLGTSLSVLSKSATPEEIQKSIQRANKIAHEQNLLVPAIEERFFKLVKAGEKYGFNTDQIMEQPNDIGSTVFETATLFSVNICQYILTRNIRVNNVVANFVYPVFSLDFPTEMWEKMLKKGINPKVISGKGFE